MPPKKPEGTKKKKKENERELALARARAEEEARLLEIRLEQEREAQEARDAEILAQKLSKQYEEHELARQERRTAEEMNALALVKQLEAIHEDKMWQHFKNCERLPFVYNWSDINAFCEEWKSSTAVQDALDANDTSLAAFGVQLKDFLAILRTVSDELNMTYLTNQKQTMLQLRDRLQPLQTRFRLMLDQLTYTVGQRPNLFQEPGVENLTFQRALLPPDEFRLAFWVNLTKNPRIREIDFPDVGIHLQLSRCLIASDVVVRALWTAHDLAFDQHTALLPWLSRIAAAGHDVSQMALPPALTLLSGILQLDLLEVPQLVTMSGHWTITPLCATGDQEATIAHLPYPPKGYQVRGAEGAATPPPPASAGEDDAALSPDAAAAAAAAEAYNADDDVNSSNEFAFTVTFPLAEDTYVDGSANIWQYHPSTQLWSDTGIADVMVDLERRLVRATLRDFHPIALMQPATLEFPLRDWYITADAADAVEIGLRGQIHNLTFTVTPRGCAIVEDETTLIVPSSLRGRDDVPFLEMLTALARAGYSFMRLTDADNLRVGVIVKEPGLTAQLVASLAERLHRADLHGHSANRRLISQRAAWRVRPRAGQGWHTLVHASRQNVGEGRTAPYTFVVPSDPPAAPDARDGSAATATMPTPTPTTPGTETAAPATPAVTLKPVPLEKQRCIKLAWPAFPTVVAAIDAVLEDPGSVAGGETLVPDVAPAKDLSALYAAQPGDLAAPAAAPSAESATATPVDAAAPATPAPETPATPTPTAPEPESAVAPLVAAGSDAAGPADPAAPAPAAMEGAEAPAGADLLDIPRPATPMPPPPPLNEPLGGRAALPEPLDLLFQKQIEQIILGIGLLSY